MKATPYIVRRETMITLEEMKNYLRIDFDDDNDLLNYLIVSSKRMCMDVARIDDESEFDLLENAKIAVMYAVAYQYEHREDCNHNALLLSLRAMLFGTRKAGF